jgi:hypothetical protein
MDFPMSFAEIVTPIAALPAASHSFWGSWWSCLVFASIYTLGIFKTAYSGSPQRPFPDQSAPRPIFRTVLIHSGFLVLVVCVVRGFYGTNLAHYRFGRGTLAEIIVFASLFVVGRVEIEWIRRNGQPE